MATITNLNKFNRDSNFTKTSARSYTANDSTSRFVLGLGQTMCTDIPPPTSGIFGNVYASIFGDYVQHSSESIYDCYSKIDKGNIQYYIDTDFANPFRAFFGENNSVTFKQVLPNHTVDYSRQTTADDNCIFKNQWFLDSQKQREDIQALQMKTILRNDYIPAQLCC